MFLPLNVKSAKTETRGLVAGQWDRPRREQSGGFSKSPTELPYHPAVLAWTPKRNENMYT